MIGKWCPCPYLLSVWAVSEELSCWWMQRHYCSVFSLFCTGGLYKRSKCHKWFGLEGKLMIICFQPSMEKDFIPRPVVTGRTKNNNFELEESKFRLYIRNLCFMVRVVRGWNRLSKRSCACPIIGYDQGQIGWYFD